VAQRQVKCQDAAIADPGDVTRRDVQGLEKPRDVIPHLFEGLETRRIRGPPVAAVFDEDRRAP